MYVRLAGNELKHPVWGMGAMDYLNAIVTGEHPMSAVYYGDSDGEHGGKAAFIKNVIREYRELAQQEIMDRRDEFPAFVEHVERRAEQRADERWPLSPQIMQRPRGLPNVR